MASIAFIEKRIAGKTAELDKLNKKLNRIKAAQATDWEKNPYSYTETDLRYTLSDIDECQKSLDKYRAQLQEAEEKSNSRNVPAILNFLAQWKNNCAEYYGKGLLEAYKMKAEIKEINRQMQNYRYGTDEYSRLHTEYESLYKELYIRLHGEYEDIIGERNGRKIHTKVKVKDGDLEYILPMMREDTYEKSMARLWEDLNTEADRKYDFIIERTVAITGTITDASGLEVGSKGDLNGYILGEKGRAHVQTIGAGGYNIQCYHFRTLIHKA